MSYSYTADACFLQSAGKSLGVISKGLLPLDFDVSFLVSVTLINFRPPQKKSSCTVADRSFSVGTIGEILQALVSVAGGRGVAGRLSNRLLPVLVAGVRDSDPEVRNNSVFGLGCLAQAAGPICVSYPSYLCLCVSGSVDVCYVLMQHFKNMHNFSLVTCVPETIP